MLGFNARHLRAEAWVRTESSRLIEGIIEDQKDAIRAFLTAGIEDGRSPRGLALDLVGRINRASGRREGGVIGLNAQQTDAVIRAARELASGDPAQMLNYLGRKRRDTRFDGLVRAAIKAEKPLAQADIDRITGRYKDRLLKLRGDTIARTEMLNGLRAGRHEGYQQLVDSGAVAPSRIMLTWQATPDKFTRHSHMALNGAQVRFGQPFVTELGSRMDYPGDITQGALAADVIGCRCSAFYRILPRG